MGLFPVKYPSVGNGIAVLRAFGLALASQGVLATR